MCYFLQREIICVKLNTIKLEIPRLSENSRKTIPYRTFPYRYRLVIGFCVIEKETKML